MGLKHLLLRLCGFRVSPEVEKPTGEWIGPGVYKAPNGVVHRMKVDVDMPYVHCPNKCPEQPCGSCQARYLRKERP